MLCFPPQSVAKNSMMRRAEPCQSESLLSIKTAILADRTLVKTVLNSIQYLSSTSPNRYRPPILRLWQGGRKTSLGLKLQPESTGVRPERIVIEAGSR